MRRNTAEKSSTQKCKSGQLRRLKTGGASCFEIQLKKTSVSRWGVLWTESKTEQMARLENDQPITGRTKKNKEIKTRFTEGGKQGFEKEKIDKKRGVNKIDS